MADEVKIDLDKLDLRSYSLEELVALHLKLLNRLEDRAYQKIKAIKLEQEAKDIQKMSGEVVSDFRT